MNWTSEDFLEKYQPRGIHKAGELLLHPKDALQFLDDIKEARVVILGVNTWYYTETNSIAESLESLDLSILSQVERVAEESVKAAKRFVRHLLPEGVSYVSFVFDD